MSNSVYLMQHELGLAADEGVRQLMEQADGEVSAAERATAMKVATRKRAQALLKKMSKLVALANPDLTDGWLREVEAHLCKLCLHFSTSLWTLHIPIIWFDFCRLDVIIL